MSGTYPAVEIDFAPGIASSAVPAGGDWVDITSKVLSWSSFFGRQDPFTQPGAGTADLALDNSGGLFDPDNSGGTYYGNLKAGMWFRIRGGTTTANTDVFYGQVSIDGFQVSAGQFPDNVVKVHLVDQMEFLANTDLPSSVYRIEVEADSPQAWWRLGEANGTTAFDSSGHGRHGTYRGGATFNSRAGLIYGEADNAILLETGMSVLLPQVRTDWGFYVEGWVDVPSTVTYDGPIYFQSDNAGGTGLYTHLFVGYKVLAGVAYAYVEELVAGTMASDGAYRQDPNPLTAGKHRIAAYIPAAGSTMPTALKLYVDGVAVTGGDGGFMTPQPAFPSTMTYTIIGPAEATVDEVAVYGSDIGATREAAHYTAGHAPWGSELTSARATHLADAIAFSSTNRNIDTGASTVQPASLAGGDTNSALLDVAKAENGLVYIDHQDGGKLRLVARRTRLTASASTTSQVTFGDSGSEVVYDALDLIDDRIINVAVIQRSNGSAAKIEDSTSKTTYGRRSFSDSGLLFETDLESQYRAEQLVAERKDRHRRPRSITLHPTSSSAGAWSHVFARKINDRVTVKWRPSYGGTYTYTCWIEGVGQKWTARDGLTSTFYLSLVPFDTTGAPYWIWGTSTWETGTNTARWSY